jgi:hypothetical protein
MIYLNVYDIGRVYGGPEEGGWWYDTGIPVASIPFEEGDKLIEAVTVYLENRYQAPRYRVIPEDKFAEYFPLVKPHYE